jgi:hypothetical protein
MDGWMSEWMNGWMLRKKTAEWKKIKKERVATLDKNKTKNGQY